MIVLCVALFALCFILCTHFFIKYIPKSIQNYTTTINIIGECVQTGKDRDGCPKVVNLGSTKTDLFYERKKYGFKKR